MGALVLYARDILKMIRYLLLPIIAVHAVCAILTYDILRFKRFQGENPASELLGCSDYWQSKAENYIEE